MNNIQDAKINYSYNKLDNLKNGLYEQRDNLQIVLDTIKSVEEIEEELNKKIEALTDIIDNVNIANQTSLGVDMDIANQMGVKG